MFRSIAKAVSKRFAIGKKPVAEESPLVAPCPKINDNEKPENAPIPDDCGYTAGNAVLDAEVNELRTFEHACNTEMSRCAAKDEAPVTELNENGTTDDAFIAEFSPCAADHEISVPELHCNGGSGNASIPYQSQSVSGNEIRMRAYLKWEASGKPKGNDSRFWLQAKEELLESQSAAGDEIRRRAYLKWEAAGKPKGADSLFWLGAKQEVLEGK